MITSSHDTDANWNVVRADIIGLGAHDQYAIRDSNRNVIAGPVTKAMAFEIAAKHNEFVFAVRGSGLSEKKGTSK